MVLCPRQDMSPKAASRPRTREDEHEVNAIAPTLSLPSFDTRPPAPMSAQAVLKISSKVSLFSAAAGEVVHMVDGLALFVHPTSTALQVLRLAPKVDACRTTGAAFTTSNS